MGQHKNVFHMKIQCYKYYLNSFTDTFHSWQFNVDDTGGVNHSSHNALQLQCHYETERLTVVL